MKAISFTVLIAMFLAFASDAEAQETYNRAKSHHGGAMSGKASNYLSPEDYQAKRNVKPKTACPTRTCGMAGTSYAYDVRNCSAANCRK
jgi:hypothetical protein